MPGMDDSTTEIQKELKVGLAQPGFFSALFPSAATHVRGRGYAFKMSRLDSTRSIKGRMPSSLEMANDSPSRDMAFSWSPGSLRWSSVSA